MLKSIDILIGLAVVMLVASMAVTVMTGFVTHIRNSRGRHLQQGIGDLLGLIHPDFVTAATGEIAKAVLTHPLIRDKVGRMGTVIHREELTKILMELAAGCGPQKLKPELRQELAATLERQGIANPAQTLDKIRLLALQLERTSPELSNMARANLAILHEAESHFVAKVNTWFDQTMDRVSQRFTLTARAITFTCGLLLAVVLQLDSIAIVNRISVDDALRESLRMQAQSISAKTNGEAPPGRDLYRTVIDQGVISVPAYPEDFSRFRDFRHLTGIVITTLLLSLGAPFWYGALNKLLQLRSKIADVDDEQRRDRQSAQLAVATPAGPAPVSPLALTREQHDG